MAKNKKNIQIFEYNGKHITFDFGNGKKMVNATQMLKSFPKKKMNNFLRTTQTKQFIETYDRYAKKRFGNDYEVLRVIKGGDAINNKSLQGTWMDERLALKFAAWLSPEFEIWIIDRIYELLTKGQTAINQPEEMISKEQLEWVFRKIQDNSMENYHLSNILKELEQTQNEKKKL